MAVALERLGSAARGSPEPKLSGREDPIADPAGQDLRDRVAAGPGPLHPDLHGCDGRRHGHAGPRHRLDALLARQPGPAVPPRADQPNAASPRPARRRRHPTHRRAFDDRDKSANFLPLAIASMGESWRDCHQRHPHLRPHGGQIDRSAAILRILEKSGWAQTRTPPRPVSRVTVKPAAPVTGYVDGAWGSRSRICPPSIRRWWPT